MSNCCYPFFLQSIANIIKLSALIFVSQLGAHLYRTSDINVLFDYLYVFCNFKYQRKCSLSQDIDCYFFLHH